MTIDESDTYNVQPITFPTSTFAARLSYVFVGLFVRLGHMQIYRSANYTRNHPLVLLSIDGVFIPIRLWPLLINPAANYTTLLPNHPAAIL